jgi:hypothetical protein
MRFKTKMKRVMALLLTVVMMLGSIVPVQAACPSLSDSKYMKTVVLSTGNNTRVYTDSSLTLRGTSKPYKIYSSAIYAYDEIYVYSMNDVYCYISYPTSSGRRYGYIKTSDITANNYSKDAVTSTGTFTTYKKAGSTKYGYVENGDTVYTIASSGSWKQIIYNVGSKWKMAWCSNSNYNKYLQGSSTSTGTSTSSGSLSDSADRLVNYALSQVGVGDDKGNNNVVFNTWYYGRTISGSGYPWCAAFVSYCAYQTGVLDTYIPKHSSCNSGVSWFKNKSQFYKSQYYGGSYTPKKGDIVYYTSNGSTSCHVGIITSSPVNGYLQTVEGNVYCSGGDYRVVNFTKNAKRRVNSSYVLGYGVWY